jgi:rhodanese-related sulfurtransferase
MAHAGGQDLVSDTIKTISGDGRVTVRLILREALLVAVVGLGLAFAANQISPRGLVLTRNYFPSGVSRPGPTRVAANTNGPALSPVEQVAMQLKEQGLQSVDGWQAARLFHDPRYQQGAVAFIDARDEQHYRAGHIPGAREFNPYYPEKYFAAVLPACRQAEQIVVYCNGGDCDDSESAALLLRDVGITTNKLFIYIGGFEEWNSNRLPVEVGDRNSGRLSPARP